MAHDTETVDSPMSREPSLVLPAFVLLGLTLATQLASLAWNASQTFLSIVVPSAIVIAAVTTPLIILGLKLGPTTGLGAPLLNDLLSRHPVASGKLLRDARLAVSLGLAVGALLLLLRVVLAPYLPPELQALGYRGVVGSLLVAVSAAVTEEIWLRLGIMSILAWLFMRVSGRSELGPVTAWLAIVVAAALFGAIHLPQLAASGAADFAGVTGTMLGNMLVGTVCGWLYWRRSLIAAILAHFAIDLVLHVLPSIVSLPT